ncbi:Ypp1 protein [Maudiozyma humilis]|uniref:Cargo-transport protein YPP1 n=1 Tax=Maudiozyma humilis TaxID=51915 RepID=A0AAV5RZ79_MAUHU|nr:Ypp1 protein [Kazachstania humilis]
MSHTDRVREALEARILGAPTSQSGIASLDAALALQFRLHYHLFGNGLKPEVARVLLKECTRLDTSMNESITMVAAAASDPGATSIVEKTLYNAMAAVQFYNGDSQGAQKSLAKAQAAERPAGKSYRSFLRLLELENLYYSGLVLDDSAKAAQLYAQRVLKCITKIPSASQGLLHSYLRLIARAIGTSGAGIASLKQMCERVGASTPLVCYLYLLTGNVDASDDAQLLEIAGKALAGAKFPMASESNSTLLEQTHVLLQVYFQSMQGSTHLIDTDKWHTLIITSIKSTFQSKYVARAAMAFFGVTGNTPEAILNFNNYLKYSNKERELAKTDSVDKFIDPVAIIDSITFILQRSAPRDNIDKLYDFDATAALLKTNLDEFYGAYHLQYIDARESLQYLSNGTRLVLPRSTCQALIQSWETLYSIRARQLEYMLSNELSSYLCNAMALTAPEDKAEDQVLNLQFQYAYCLAQQRQIEPCIDFLENAVLEAAPMFYKAWHLLALCRSIQEDKEVSYKIICSVLNALEQEFTTSNYSGVKHEDKWQYINMKITEIHLINEIFGTPEALESMPELFTVYNNLFDESKSENKKTENMPFNKTKEYLLQSIWLLAAQLYMNGEEHIDDARGAIREARKVAKEFTNVNISVADGQLLFRQGEFKAALKLFEEALYYDDLNADAIIGFAQLVFPDETTNSASEQQLVDYCRLSDGTENPVTPKFDAVEYDKFFGNRVDKSAVFARLKLLIDCALIKSVDAYFSPEIWWYLSLIHEKYGNREMKDTLLNCIKNKETCPLRPFRFCDY